jgi:release factor glutamine methyltransferase
MTLAQWIRHGESQLMQGPHPDRARLDAEILLQHTLGKDKAWLMAHGKEGFGGCKAINYSSLLDRRAKGEPIQYILGEQEFYGLPFRVTPDVLIPRPETEILVDRILEWSFRFLGRPEPVRVVDVGTGSGAIAVALARKLPFVVTSKTEFTAIDLSDAALAVARFNAARNGVADRIRFLRGDLFEPVPDQRFDIVVSNPPYVSHADRELLPIEVRDFEPGLALFGGDDGLEVYRRLIPAALEVLVPGGLLALELGSEQDGAIAALLAAAGFRNAQLFPDMRGIPRVAMASRR